MEIDRKELKYRARERMGSAVPAFWAVALVYFLLTQGVSLGADLLASLLKEPAAESISTAALFLTLLVALYTTVVSFGLKLWSLWTWRRLDPGLGALTQGFSVVGKVLWMEVQIILRVIPWCFLLTMGAAILLVLCVPVGDLRLLPGLAMLLSPVMAAVLWFIMLRYTLAPYLLADRPDDGASAAVRRSVQLMRGWTWELFKLELSFLGWVILYELPGFLAMGFFSVRAGVFQPGLSPDQMIALLQTVNYSLPVQCVTALVTLPVFLWLIPYREVARAGFYDARLRLRRQELNADLPPL